MLVKSLSRFWFDSLFLLSCSSNVKSKPWWQSLKRWSEHCLDQRDLASTYVLHPPNLLVPNFKLEGLQVSEYIGKLDKRVVDRLERLESQKCHHSYIPVLAKPSPIATSLPFPSHSCMTHRRSETQLVIWIIRSHMDHNPKHTWHLWCLLFYSVPVKSLTFRDYKFFVCVLNNRHSNSIFWYQSGR